MSEVDRVNLASGRESTPTLPNPPQLIHKGQREGETTHSPSKAVPCRPRKATGTENRREMKRGKRGRETAQQAGKGEKREGRRRAGLGETPQVTPLWWGGHNRRVTTDAAIRVDCMKETGPLAWGRGRKGNYAKATVTVQRTEGREEGKSQSRHHQAAGTSKTRKNGCVPECLEPAKCWREPSLVPSRAPWEGRCALKKG